MASPFQLLGWREKIECLLTLPKLALNYQRLAQTIKETVMEFKELIPFVLNALFKS